MSRRIALHSPLTPRAVAEKLREVVGARDKVVTVAGVTGQGSETDMRLFYYRPRFQNGFMTQLVATMRGDGGGTAITGRIGPPVFVAVFMVLWFGFLAVFAAVATGVIVATHSWGSGTWMFLAIPLGMAAVAALICWIGLRTRGADEAAILDFLSRTIDAHEVTA